MFSDAFASMANIVMSDRLVAELRDETAEAKNAIDEILSYYHVKAKDVPENLKTFADQLEYTMRPLGIMRRTVFLDGEWYKDAIGPMLGTRKDDGSTIALIPNSFSGYTFYDKKSGKRVRLNKKVAALIDDEAVCFYKPLPLHEIGVKDLFIYMIRSLSIADYSLFALCILVTSLVGLLAPRVSNIIYRYAIPGRDMTLLLAIFAFLISVTLTQLLLGGMRQLLQNRMLGKAMVQAKAALMMRVLSLPTSFFKDYAAGDIASRMNQLTELCNILTATVLGMGLTSLFSLVNITQMVKYGPSLLVPGMMVIIATVAVTAISAVIKVRINRKMMQQAAKSSGLEYALITGVQKIKLAGAEKRAFAKWAASYHDVARLTYAPPSFLKFSTAISTCINLIGTVVIYFFTIKNQIPLADYFAFNVAYTAVMTAFNSIVLMVTDISQAKPIMEMLQPILGTLPEVSENKKTVTRLSGGIELNNVCFRYNDHMRMIIDDLSLKIRPGQYVAIVGETGSGKSTLMRLMLGFETPQKGAIYYDGKDMNTLDLKSLRRNIGTVLQNGKLFSGDVFSNITISAPWLTMKDAWEAAELAGIAEDIREMPMEMHTLIAEGGGGISGGQRQRIMIARAIAPKPRILMFDEATSALDNLTQKQVSESLDKLRCTRVVIAHRLSTIRQCDRIIMLAGGKIIEDGTYDELIAKNGAFADLVARQQLESEK